MNMDFWANKTPVKKRQVHLEEHILETFILVLMINGRILWARRYYCSIEYYCANYYVSATKYGVKCGTWLRFWEKKGWINSIDL